MDSNTFCCPFCESVDFIKYGKRNGNQRFKCLFCGHVFLKTTNTIFSSTKLNRSCLRNLIVLIIDGTYTSIQDTRLRVANIKKCLPIKERRVSN